MSDDDAKKTLMPVVINRITLLLAGCEVAADRMAKKVSIDEPPESMVSSTVSDANLQNGYTQLFEIVDSVGPPDSSTLQSVLSMATPGDNKRIRNIKPVVHLIRWVHTTDYENPDQQVWLTEAINALCTASIQNRMLCCQSSVIVELIQTLRSHQRLNPRSAHEVSAPLKI